jgi:hypothetical protein
MDIPVKRIEGDIVHMIADPSETIEAVKNSVGKKAPSYSPGDFKLSLNGKSLDETKTLADYDIGHETLLFLVRLFV